MKRMDKCDLIPCEFGKLEKCEALLSTCHIVNKIHLKKNKVSYIKYGKEGKLIYVILKCRDVLLNARTQILRGRNWVLEILHVPL